MDNLAIAAAGALWLGILTSLHPCTLATNIAAISYIGSRVDRPRRVLLSGLLYTLGRVLIYLVLGIASVAGLLSIPQVSTFLQRYAHRLIGPVLIVVGLFLLEWIRLPVSGPAAAEKVRERAEKAGIWGAGILGIVFALSFCPPTAALFFGALIPLSVQSHSMVLVPSLYGVGTGLPVMLFAGLLTLGARAVGKGFNRLTQFERWARCGTAATLILVGVYLSLVYIFEVGS